MVPIGRDQNSVWNFIIQQSVMQVQGEGPNEVLEAGDDGGGHLVSDWE